MNRFVIKVYDWEIAPRTANDWKRSTFAEKKAMVKDALIKRNDSQSNDKLQLLLTNNPAANDFRLLVVTEEGIQEIG